MNVYEQQGAFIRKCFDLKYGDSRRTRIYNPDYDMDQLQELVKLRDAYEAFCEYYNGSNIRNFNAKAVGDYLGMAEVDDCTFDEADNYEYNRLFVGPSILAAAPFESVYVREDRLTMQEETLSVRRCYEAAGIEVKEKNTIPDDHLALELEFLGFLVNEIGRLKEEGQSTEDVEAFYRHFLNEHILNWVPKHCKEIETVSTSKKCIYIANLLHDLVQKEAARIN